MKEGVKNRILAASRDKVNKLNELRSKKTINENEYNEAVQAVNSQANLQRNQIDSTFAKSILGIQESKLNLTSKNQQDNSEAIAKLAETLKIPPESIGLISKYMDPNKTAAENTFAIQKMMSENPNNEITNAIKDATARNNAALQAEINNKFNMNAADNATKERVAQIQADVDQGRINLETAKYNLDNLVE